MALFTTREGVDIAYHDEFYGDPWAHDSAKPLLLVHGVAESSAAWSAWVGALGSTYRLIRVDLPGFGASKIDDAQDYSWDSPRLAADLLQLADHIGLARFHLVGAKYGGSIAARLAIDHGERLDTLAIVGGPVAMRGRAKGIDLSVYSAQIESLGVSAWAEASMAARLGSSASPEAMRWWAQFMGKAPLRPTIACSRAAGQLDLARDFAQVRVPTLFVTTRGSPLLPVDDYARMVSTFPSARLEILDTDGYHPAATHAIAAARLVDEHIRRNA